MFLWGGSWLTVQTSSLYVIEKRVAIKREREKRKRKREKGGGDLCIFESLPSLAGFVLRYTGQGFKNKLLQSPFKHDY